MSKNRSTTSTTVHYEFTHLGGREFRFLNADDEAAESALASEAASSRKFQLFLVLKLDHDLRTFDGDYLITSTNPCLRGIPNAECWSIDHPVGFDASLHKLCPDNDLSLLARQALKNRRAREIGFRRTPSAEALEIGAKADNLTGGAASQDGPNPVGSYTYQYDKVRVRGSDAGTVVMTDVEDGRLEVDPFDDPNLQRKSMQEIEAEVKTREHRKHWGVEGEVVFRDKHGKIVNRGGRGGAGGSLTVPAGAGKGRGRSPRENAGHSARGSGTSGQVNADGRSISKVSSRSGQHSQRGDFAPGGTLITPRRGGSEVEDRGQRLVTPRTTSGGAPANYLSSPRDTSGSASGQNYTGENLHVTPPDTGRSGRTPRKDPKHDPNLYKIAAAAPGAIVGATSATTSLFVARPGLQNRREGAHSAAALDLVSLSSSGGCGAEKDLCEEYLISEWGQDATSSSTHLLEQDLQESGSAASCPCETSSDELGARHVEGEHNANASTAAIAPELLDDDPSDPISKPVAKSSSLVAVMGRAFGAVGVRNTLDRKTAQARFFDSIESSSTAAKQRTPGNKTVGGTGTIRGREMDVFAEASEYGYFRTDMQKRLRPGEVLQTEVPPCLSATSALNANFDGAFWKAANKGNRNQPPPLLNCAFILHTHVPRFYQSDEELSRMKRSTDEKRLFARMIQYSAQDSCESIEESKFGVRKVWRSAVLHAMNDQMKQMEMQSAERKVSQGSLRIGAPAIGCGARKYEHDVAAAHALAGLWDVWHENRKEGRTVSLEISFLASDKQTFLVWRGMAETALKRIAPRQYEARMRGMKRKGGLCGCSFF